MADTEITDEVDFRSDVKSTIRALPAYKCESKMLP
jgi:hypothetical protein